MASAAPFHILTIFNDRGQYDLLRQSFATAGFDESIARFTGLDNSTANNHDPYRVIDNAIAASSESYVIVCHQDVRLDRGPRASDLLRAIIDISQKDPNWGVLGNAGTTASLEYVTHLRDPHGDTFANDLPRQVVALDENFLIFRSGTALRCSPELSGFHLYGTDICLRANRLGMRAYVIDFRLTHLSAGNNKSQAFDEAVAAFESVWNRHFVLGVILTPAADLALGANRLIRRFTWSPSFRRHAADRGRVMLYRGGPLPWAIAGWDIGTHMIARYVMRKYPPPSKEPLIAAVPPAAIAHDR